MCTRVRRRKREGERKKKMEFSRYTGIQTTGEFGKIEYTGRTGKCQERSCVSGEGDAVTSARTTSIELPHKIQGKGM